MASQKVVFKAIAMSRDLEVRLKNRIANIVIHSDVDSDRFPTLKCSIGAKSCFIRISTDHARSDADGHVDALGLDQRVYTPHKTEILKEEAATPPAPATNDMLAQVLAEVAKNGTKVVVKGGTAVEDAATFAAAAILATTDEAVIRSDAINPLTKQM